jgi:hypothetical protein
VLLLGRFFAATLLQFLLFCLQGSKKVLEVVFVFLEEQVSFYFGSDRGGHEANLVEGRRLP